MYIKIMQWTRKQKLLIIIYIKAKRELMLYKSRYELVYIDGKWMDLKGEKEGKT